MVKEETKKKLKKIDEGNDKYCRDILGFLIIHRDRIRFNKLYDVLTEKMKYKISRPTLADHLNHLVRKRYVVRKTEGKQNVTYRLNDGYFKGLIETIKEEEEISKHLSEKKESFNSLTMDEQLEACIGDMVLRNLRQLEIEIRNGIYPGNEFENNLQIMFINNQSNKYTERRLLENSLKDKEYGDKLIQKIEESIEQGMKELYDNYEEVKKTLESST